jgi:hypothetical protein
VGFSESCIAKTMPRLFWPNFDFEHELARGTAWQAPDRLIQLNAALACSFCSVAEQDDVIVVPKLRSTQTTTTISVGEQIQIQLVESDRATTDDRFRGPEWELIPWGVTASLESLARKRHWTWNQPDCNLVRKLNDRETSNSWEKLTETMPCGVEIIDSIEELQTGITNLDRDKWVLKARYGMSARERILGTGTTLTSQQTGWIEKRLKEQGSLVLEPWLESAGEMGIQIQVPASGQIEMLAVLPLMNTAHGEYQGSRLFLSESEQQIWELATRIAMQIAEDFQRQGYFGPLGIDAMRYRDGDEIKLRPIQDINARWTMGRIAWEWGRLLDTDRRATWYQGQKAVDLLSDSSLSNRLIRTSPDSWPTETNIPSVLLME